MNDLTTARLYLAIARAYVAAAPGDALAQDNATWHWRNAQAAVALAADRTVDRAALNEGLKRITLLLLADAGV